MMIINDFDDVNVYIWKRNTINHDYDINTTTMTTTTSVTTINIVSSPLNYYTGKIKCDLND